VRWLLLAVPVSWVLGWLAAPPLAVFVVSGLAVVPLAAEMGEATETLARRAGPTLGGFLNATFGNAAELIVAIVALRAGLLDLVKASLTGSILGNLLLILGLALVAGGRRRPTVTFNRTAAGMSGAMLLLAVVGLRAQPPTGATLVLRIDEEGRPPNVFAANQLFQLNGAIEAHVGRVDRPVVYAADLSLLQAVHGLGDMKAWVRHMNGRCGAKGGALVLASMDRELAEQVQKDSVPSEGLQAMLESLANPIRRAVVAYVVASGPVAYSGILKKNFVDSSSKLSFHLQKLQSDGLLAKGDAGRYVVTEAGQRAWQVVRALSDRKPPSLLISKS